MPVFLVVDCFCYEIGSSDFLHSFFSTISYHLEPNGWGTKYPYLMNGLYQGNLNWSQASNAIKEAKEIRQELSGYNPSQVIWDIEDLESKQPWREHVSDRITSLANYFVTSDGEDLFEVLYKALYCSIEEQQNVEIKFYPKETITYVKLDME
jgi:2,3-bisphosphoglycerate-dependent phosphoglycerate mutase